MKEDKPITFKVLGKTLPKLPKVNPKFTVWMSDFADYGYCPYKAWHLAQGTVPIIVPEVKLAQTIGTTIHEKLDKEHEEMVAKLPKATEKTRRNRYRPLAFDRNFRVYLYHRPFLYSGKIDDLCRQTDGHFYITDDKTTNRAPDQPWRSHLLQVWAYCAGMASTYWQEYDARHLYWCIRYRDKIEKKILGEHGDFYTRTCHENLWGSLKEFESIYHGNDPGYEVSRNKCIRCGVAPSCPFKKSG